MITSTNDVWAPFVDLNRILNDVVLNKDSSRLADLENLLKRHKPDFISLLKNASPCEADRARLKKATVDGIRLEADSSALQTLPQSVVDEAIILSDLFQLNELVALRLLQTGEAHMSHYPGMTRGLTAVLLYYDGRRALVNSFRLLLQARKGVTWNCDLPDNVTDTITQYTEALLEENMVNKILDLLNLMDWEQELARLNAACALGSHRQLRQVLDMYQQTRQNLADSLFCWSAQSALPRRDAQRVLHYLTQMEPSDSCGRLDGVQLSLLMSVMYSLSPLRMLRLSDAEEQIRSWPVLADPDYLPLMHKQLFVAPASWKCPQLLTVLQLVWAVTLTSLRTLSFSLSNSGIANVVEDDETIMDVAICDKVFLHIREIIVACESFFEEEFHVRFVHDLVTEMLVAMPLKVKELRNRADEAARTKQMHQQEGLEPPSNLPQHFEQLLQLLSALYEGDRLSLSLDYWAIDGTSQRQVALNKFVRVAGDLLPAPLYVPYLQLLTALSGSVGSAQHCYTLLTSSVHTVTISRLFSTFHTYHNTLQYNVTPIYSGNPMSADTRPPTKQLSAHELQAMLASLKLICVLAEQDVSCRVSMFEKPGWSPLPVFVSLLRHAVPTLLKAQLLRTLTAFARSPELAAHLWQELEAAQILQTTASSHPARGILMELEEVESRAEQFPQTRAFIGLLSVLVEGSLPLGLGTGSRPPGLSPYLNFVVHDVLVNFNSRAYKDAAEKYEVGAECVQFLLKVVELWDGSVTDPTANGAAVRPVSPGETVLLHMMQESKLLRLVLHVLEDGVRLLDAFSPFPGRQQLQRLSLLCLQLVDACLSRQSAAMPALRHSCSAPLLPGLDALLLATNPRTGAADGLLVFTKYMSYGGWLPDHACHAVSALTAVCRRVSAQRQLIALLCRDRSTQLHATHAFVECLDVHTPEDDGSPVHRARCSVLQLLISGLQLPGTSVAHLLLGMPQAAADHQDMRRRTCLHAIMDMLSQGLTAISPPTITERCPAVANMAYQVVYLLCASPLTSTEALRYLRSTHDFIYSQLRPLPASSTGLDALRHTTWLLKMAAIEIKTTASSQQRSHLSRLTRLLLDSCPALAPAVDLTALDMSLTLNQALTGTASTLVGGSGQRRKLVSFLNAVDLNRDRVHQPNWEYFDPEQISKAISECEVPGEGRQVDVKQLHSLLMAELAALQGTAAVSQRQYILHEVKAVLLYCVERNGYASWMHCSCQYMDACRQLLETILTAVPVDQLSDSRDQVLIDLTRHVLNKTVDGRCATELAGTLLLLTTCLRATTSGVASCSAVGRQAALRGVVDTLLGWESGGGQLQTGRAHLYGALLQLLLASDQQLLASVCRQYGAPLLDALCRDATSGHQIGRMLAMCCLDAILRLSDGDVSSASVDHVLGCGFVSAVCAAVTSDADALVACVRGAPSSLRPLYIYDAQMALLCCVAGCGDGRGASALLRTQLLVRLAELSALGQLPGPRAAAGVRARYRQLLLPVLRLCSALLTASSMSNNTAAAQVMQFLLSHMDLIASLLQYEPTDCSTDHLQVVGLLTSVLSLVLAKDPGRGDVVGTSMQGQYSRLRQLVTTQLCRELAAPPSSAVDSSSSDPTNIKANSAHLKVVCQLLSCYQCLVVQSGLQLPRLLFVAVDPSITAAAVGMSRDCGFLGVLVLALRHYCRLLNTSCRRLEQLQLAASDPQQLAEHHQANSVQNRPQLTELSTAQVSMVRHILETLLFLVWTHLDYVFKYRDFGAGFDNGDVTPVLMPNEMAVLKKSVPLTVTDPLLDQLQTTLKDPTAGAGHFSFSEAMIRRIRRLVKLSIH